MVIGDECFIGEHAVVDARREGLPVQDGRGRRGRHVVDRVGDAAGPHPVRPAGRVGLANVDITPEVAVRLAMAYGTSLKKGAVITTSRDTSRSARALKRAMIGGPQPRRRQRGGPRAGVGAAHPLPGPQPRNAGRDHRAAGARGLRHGRDPLLRRRRPRHHRGMQRKIERLLVPGGLPPGVRRRDRRHRVPAPGARVLHGGAGGHRRRRAASASGASRSCSTTPTARRRSPCPACSPSSVPRCWRSTRSPPPRPALPASTSHARRRVGDAGAHVGQRPRAGHRPGRRAGGPRRRQGHVLEATRVALRAAHVLSPRKPGGRASPCRCPRPAVAERISLDDGGRGGVDQARPALSWRPRPAATSGSRRTRTATVIWPGFLPAFDAAATFVKVLDLLAKTSQDLAAVVDSAAPRVHRAHETVPSPGSARARSCAR